MKYKYLLFAMFLSACTSCERNNQQNPDNGDDNGDGGKVTSVVNVTSDLCWELTTDKAMYAPGETVRITATGTPTDNTFVRYRCGDQIIQSDPVRSTEWTWAAPLEDGRGYLVEVYRQKDDTTEQIVGTIGVDVSSDWRLYPRYGFVATFDKSKTNEVIASEMAFLNRCHINGVQFQDWHWKHHYPAPVKNGQLLSEFTDIANRMNSTAVIKEYIRVQHAYGMKSIFYNLCFGALDDAEQDGVKMKEWGLYNDPNHGYQDRHGLPSSWKSDIYLLDPGNEEWLNYLADRNEEVYQHFDFDGYQIDQLGWRGGDRYTYSGQTVIFNNAYAKFVNAMHDRHPNKDLIMNSVGSFGSQAILGTGHPVLAYNECWDYEKNFSDLRNIVKANDVYSSGKAKTVFAAYMNYSMDNCEFNTPGVLLTDAVMFALGGGHLELGDHMLCREYFPYTGVRMSEGLRTQIIRYYDFHTAYENWLRGGGKEEQLNVTVGEGKNVGLVAWPPKMGKLTTFCRKQDDAYVLHLLNFLNADSESWRDMNGTMPAPRVVTKLPLEVPIADKVSHIYVASPDYHAGALVELPFEQQNGVVKFTLPQLKYWDMIVIKVGSKN